MVPMKLVGDLSNVHLYENSWEASRKLMSRDPMKYNLPELVMRDDFHYAIDDLKWDLDNVIKSSEITQFKLENYQSYDNIPVEMLAPNG